jgi:hypothetical protein
LIGSQQDDTRKLACLRVYGSSASAVKLAIESIVKVNPGKDAVQTEETGRVSVTPEIYSSSLYCGDGGCGGGSGDGESLLFCLLIIAVFMAVFTIVWAVVMIAFSILTVGGFLKKRYRTLLLVERPNRQFMGKIALQVIEARGVLEYPFGFEEYDDWMHHTFNLFVRLKVVRQVSLFLGFGWGLVEVGFKLNQILFNPADYYLWPFRFVMIAIFAPLLLYSPILEVQFRQAFGEVEDIVRHLIAEEQSFGPEYPMIFANDPKIVRALPVSFAKKEKYKE